MTLTPYRSKYSCSFSVNDSAAAAEANGISSRIGMSRRIVLPSVVIVEKALAAAYGRRSVRAEIERRALLEDILAAAASKVPTSARVPRLGVGKIVRAAPGARRKKAHPPRSGALRSPTSRALVRRRLLVIAGTFAAGSSFRHRAKNHDGVHSNSGGASGEARDANRRRPLQRARRRMCGALAAGEHLARAAADRR